MSKVNHPAKQPFFSAPPRLSVENIGTAVLLLISLAASFAYLRLGLARVFYPYALDLVEEGMVMQAWRVAQNLPVFVPPNAEFVPQVYMPLFTWLGGQLMHLTGFVFWPLRLISFLSVVGTAVLIFIIGWRESRSKTAAFVGSGLFLGGYRLVGGWYDLARVDALFAFLSLAGLVLLVHRRRRGTQSYAEETQRGTEVWVVLGAVLLGLAFLTKQNGLLLAAVAGFCFFTAESAEDAKKNKKSALSAFIRVLIYFVIPFAAVAVVPVLILQQVSGGWFSYYVVTIAYASPLDLGRLRNIFLWELGAGMGVLVGLAALLVMQQFRRLEIRDWRLVAVNLQSLISNNPWLVFVGTAVFISIAGRSTVGGNLNNMLIGYAFLCLIPALSWNFQRKGAKGQRAKESAQSAESVDKMSSRVTWVVAMLVQFVLVTFPLNSGLPPQFLPTAEMRAAGNALVERVAAEPGEVWLLMHPSVAVRAGKRPYAHLQSLWHARQRGADPLSSDLVELIEQEQFAQIISDESDFFETEPAFLELLLAHYEAVATLPPTQSSPTLNEPVIRPLTIYTPR
ncbi:MAG: glycosyltransferase family 39 protein [Ardenticatenaceae bacterium]|nr:glycosyltransferase family 39 protein [Ardenticatenaceae bacterium]MCB8946640.1 glycosyltransferase family 39 protein [Ardenticatenaceae bacterium]